MSLIGAPPYFSHSSVFQGTVYDTRWMICLMCNKLRTTKETFSLLLYGRAKFYPDFMFAHQQLNILAWVFAWWFDLLWPCACIHTLVFKSMPAATLMTTALRSLTGNWWPHGLYRAVGSLHALARLLLTVSSICVRAVRKELLLH